MGRARCPRIYPASAADRAPTSLTGEARQPLPRPRGQCPARATAPCRWRYMHTARRSARRRHAGGLPPTPLGSSASAPTRPRQRLLCPCLRFSRRRRSLSVKQSTIPERVAPISKDAWTIAGAGAWQSWKAGSAGGRGRHRRRRTRGWGLSRPAGRGPASPGSCAWVGTPRGVPWPLRRGIGSAWARPSRRTSSSWQRSGRCRV